jgi:hypothetical protein
MGGKKGGNTMLTILWMEGNLQPKKDQLSVLDNNNQLDMYRQVMLRKKYKSIKMITPVKC